MEENSTEESCSTESCGSCSGFNVSKVIEKIKSVVLNPTTVWDSIWSEKLSSKEILMNYYLPVAALSAVCGFIGIVVIGATIPFVGTIRASIFPSIIHLVAQIGMSALYIILGAKIVSMLASKFDGDVTENQAAKLIAFSTLPVALGGVLAIIPFLSILNILLGLYTFYILYCGFSALSSVPEGRRLGLFLTSLVVLFITFAVIGIVVYSILPSQYAIPEVSQSLQNGLQDTLGQVDGEKAQQFLQQMQKLGEAAQQNGMN